jgi:aldose 1-epimerase
MSSPAELVLRSDALEVVLLPELGGRIHRLRAFGADLLRTPVEPGRHAEDPFFWGAYVMAPWCNRLQPGPMRVAGRTVNLTSNFGDGSAIHGQVSTRPWRVLDDGSLRVTGGDGDGWPWTYAVSAQVTVEGTTLTCDYRLVNRSDAAMPGGIGLHPWFRRPVALRVPGEAVYRANTGSAPDPEPVAAAHDLRVAAVPADDLDATWTALATPQIELEWPQAGIAARIEVETPHVLVAVATPGALDAVAVEPQTHGPDGLRRLLNGEQDALALLPAGETLRLTLRMRVEGVSLAR